MTAEGGWAGSVDEDGSGCRDLFVFGGGHGDGGEGDVGDAFEAEGDAPGDGEGDVFGAWGGVGGAEVVAGAA